MSEKEYVDGLKQIVKDIIEVEDAFTGEKGFIANQGQPLDGFSALANFRDIAQKAKNIVKPVKTTKRPFKYSRGKGTRIVLGGNPLSEALERQTL